MLYSSDAKPKPHVLFRLFLWVVCKAVTGMVVTAACYQCCYWLLEVVLMGKFIAHSFGRGGKHPKLNEVGCLLFFFFFLSNLRRFCGRLCLADSSGLIQSFVCVCDSSKVKWFRPACCHILELSILQLLKTDQTELMCLGRELVGIYGWQQHRLCRGSRGILFLLLWREILVGWAGN